MSRYITKFEELCKFSTIYQHNLNEAWKCVKFKGGLREDILATVESMEIRDYAALVNKCRLVEKYNKKLVDAKSTRGDFKKGLSPYGLKLTNKRGSSNQVATGGSSPRNHS